MANLSWAGTWDFNPGQEAVKHKNNVTGDVTGTGYVAEYIKVNTNNLSMLEYSHGSGNLDFADILYDEQKTTTKSIYYIDYDTGLWTKGQAGASSAITYTRQYDNIQSPTSFAYGTGWYASHPVTYNSLLKDKTETKSYQEAASMHRQIEYARAVKGDIAIDINCTAPTATVDGKGSLSMEIDDDVTQGTLHVGELVANPKVVATKIGETYNKKKNTTTDINRFGHFEAWKDPLVDIENNYVGDFKVQKSMKLVMTKSAPSWMEDWLPCCSGGFFDIPSRDFDKERAGQKGIFDCTCRNQSISTFKPKWNGTSAQFPTVEHQYKP
ncbi:MAG: hypothetical protein LUQ59_02230 [Methanothrix sp.]|nr:hypothetical protein [Methanothrix sp.]